MRSPFERLSPESVKYLVLTLLILNVVVIIALQILNAPLRTPAAPAGIVSYEFVKNIADANTILDSWNARQQTLAGLSLGLDYLFMLTYATLLALLCFKISARLRHSAPAIAGQLLSWAQFVAALFDAVENYALIQLLLGEQSSFWPPVSRWSATIKFGLVSVGIAYIITGYLYSRISNNRQSF